MLGGTVFLGLTVASLFYLLTAFKQKNNQLLKYALKASFFGDALIFLITLFQFFSGTQLAKHAYLLNQPWVKVAYMAFTLLSICWLFQFFIKARFFRHLNTCSQLEALTHFPARRLMFIYILMIIIFIAITHDAVRQQTYFWPF